MRRALVVAVTLSGILGPLLACGESDIVALAREKAEGEAAAEGPEHGAGVPEEPPPAPPGTPQPGEVVVGVAVEQPIAGAVGAPAPGDPGVPPPVAPGAPAPGDPGVPPPGDPNTPPAGLAGAPAPGVPAQPKPGVPVQPKPGEAGTPPPIAGPTVTIGGQVAYAGWRFGAVRIDAFDGDHSKHGTQPGIVATTKIARPGDFSLVVPQGVGKVYVEASIDEDADGKPGPQDPQGRAERYPVTVESTAVEGLRITLTKQPPPPGGGKDKGKPDDF